MPAHPPVAAYVPSAGEATTCCHFNHVHCPISASTGSALPFGELIDQSLLTMSYFVFFFVQWIILGANISNIGSGGIWAILFHLGLGGLLCVCVCVHCD